MVYRRLSDFLFIYFFGHAFGYTDIINVINVTLCIYH